MNWIELNGIADQELKTPALHSVSGSSMTNCLPPRSWQFQALRADVILPAYVSTNMEAIPETNFRPVSHCLWNHTSRWNWAINRMYIWSFSSLAGSDFAKLVVLRAWSIPCKICLILIFILARFQFSLADRSILVFKRASKIGHKANQKAFDDGSNWTFL